MRLRNVKNKDEILLNSKLLITDPYKYFGKWSEVFSNNNPIHVEIGMGMGKFIRENAVKYPNINFIGIERFDNVLVRSLPMIDEGISNLVIIRMNAIEIDKVFDKEIDMIYLNFSDPWPKKRHYSRRLSSKVFLEKYDGVFKSDKNIIMKTDNEDLFKYSVVSFSNFGYFINSITFNLKKEMDEDNIMTEYETKFTDKGMPIYRVVVSSKCNKE